MVELCAHAAPINPNTLLDEQKIAQLSRSSLGRTMLEVFTKHTLTTHFQPIIDLNSHQVFAVEALTRGPEQSPLFSPLNLFNTAADLNCLEEMDWLARQTAITNYQKMSTTHQNRPKLFLNVTVNLLQKMKHSGRTLQCLQELGLLPDQVVIELTELQPVENYDQFLNSIRHYRDMGFLVAVDDLGSGYNGLRIWSEVKPDFVKIDRHFIQDIHRYPEKQNFLEVMVTLSEKMGTKVIAEGIETQEELTFLESLNVDYVQGFLLGKPQPQILMQPSYQWHPKGLTEMGIEFEETVGSLIEPCMTVDKNFSAGKLSDIILEDPQIEWVVVLDEQQKPIGMLYREEFISRLAKPFVRELYSRKTMMDVMDTDPYIFDESTSLIVVSRRFTSEMNKTRNAFIIRDDKTGGFKGVASFVSLLKAMTNLQIQSAQYANPLSGLPGNKPIQKEIQKRLADQHPFVMIYVDVDNFKPFNDYYSFDDGDRVIVEIARILTQLSGEYQSFVGHIGGDDFVIIMEAEQNYEELCKQLLVTFRTQITRFYSKEDQQRGGIEALDRKGEKCFFPIMSLSLGVLKVHPENIPHPQKLASEATKAKKAAKNKGGNAYAIRAI